MVLSGIPNKCLGDWAVTTLCSKMSKLIKRKNWLSSFPEYPACVLQTVYSIKELVSQKGRV